MKELAKTGMRMHARLADSEHLYRDTCTDVVLISTQRQLQSTEIQGPTLKPELRMKDSKVQVTGQVSCTRASRERAGFLILERRFPEGSFCFNTTELT